MWLFLEKRVTIIAAHIGTFYVQGPSYTESSIRRPFNMEKKFKINGEEYEIHHYHHNDRQYIIFKNGERIGTYDNYEELDEAIAELEKEAEKDIKVEVVE